MHISHPQFPNSNNDPFIVTSKATNTYNCIAWAFGDNTRWYWPEPINICFWPDGIPRELHINSFIELYKLIGYKECSSGELENEIEKVAIFSDENGIPTHAARQLVNGFWTSKLGPQVDVQHTIPGIIGGVYGNVAVYMKRNRKK